MSRVAQSAGERGSLKWTQRAVNERSDVLEATLRRALPLPPGRLLEWVSPLQKDDFAEYRDETAIERLRLGRLKHPLSRFWPARGPQWDALAICGDAVLLIEAKAHVPELLSPSTQASKPSRRRIQASFGLAQRGFRAQPGCDWSRRFYQYANRLAHLHFLWKMNRVNVLLAFVYFLNDTEMNGPTTEREWQAAISVLHEALGVRGRLPPARIADVFVDVRQL